MRYISTPTAARVTLLVAVVMGAALYDGEPHRPSSRAPAFVVRELRIERSSVDGTPAGNATSRWFRARISAQWSTLDRVDACITFYDGPVTIVRAVAKFTVGPLRYESRDVVALIDVPPIWTSYSATLCEAQGE